jgi:hypothetical protein
MLEQTTSFAVETEPALACARTGLVGTGSISPQ